MQGRVRRPERSTLLPSLLIQLSTLASLSCYSYRSFLTLEFSNGRDTLCDDAAFVDCSREKMKRMAKKRKRERKSGGGEKNRGS